MQHLIQIGASPVTDGTGRIFLAGLEPGDYDLYLADVTSPADVEAGLTRGFLLSASLRPLTTSAVEMTIETTAGIPR